MEQLSWLMPLLLLPGIGLLLNAASTRYGYFQQEIHHLLEETAAGSTRTGIHTRLRARAGHFRNALVGLHLSVCIFATGSLLGAGLNLIHTAAELPVILFTALGIACLIFATAELIRESLHSQDVLIEHLNRTVTPEKQPHG